MCVVPVWRKIIAAVPVAVVRCSAVGGDTKIGFVWLLADTLNAMMALPNLIALALLSPVVFKLTRDFFANGGVESTESTESK